MMNAVIHKKLMFFLQCCFFYRLSLMKIFLVFKNRNLFHDKKESKYEIIVLKKMMF